MQFSAQTRHYRGSFPDATYSVICVDGEPAGRLIVSRSDDEMVVVDLALVPGFRRIGIGVARPQVQRPFDAGPGLRQRHCVCHIDRHRGAQDAAVSERRIVDLARRLQIVDETLCSCETNGKPVDERVDAIA